MLYNGITYRENALRTHQSHNTSNDCHAEAGIARNTRRSLEMEDNRDLYKNVFSKANSDTLNQFLHASVDDVCGHQRLTYQLFSHSTQWSSNEFNIAQELISDLLRNPAVLHLDEEKMPQEYHDLPAELQQSMRTCLSVRRDQLLKALVKEHLRKNGRTLIDFDWRVRLLMGSSKMATLKEPLLQLDLITEDDKKQEVIDMELNKDDLDMLINTLDSVG